MTRRTLVSRLVAAVVLAAPLAAQMPDARQMSGIAMPSNDVPPGTVSVRLVRTSLANNITGHPVELHAGGKVETVRTDPEGRAVFKNLPPGLPVQALAIVDGERLESQTFSLPADAGVRLVLVAGAGASMPAAAAPPPVSAAPGEVVLAGDSRVQIEFDDDTIEVFYMLEIVNPSPQAVTPATEIVFRLPDDAQQAAMLEGSSTQAAIRGTTVQVSGPFAPGVTPVQFAYSLAPAGPARALAQPLPMAWPRPQVIMTRAGSAAMSSPQLATSTEMPGQGQGFLFGVGGPLKAGDTLTLAFTGLPSRSHAGRYLALALGLLLLAGGFLWSWTTAPGTGDTARQAHLAQRRDRLMADLVRLEQQARAGIVDAGRYAARRGELVSQLERVYGELDQQPAPEQGPSA
jgi:hypothetical protein